MLNFVIYGIILGLSAGISPGPLLTLVIAQTFQHGVREGIRVAIVPLFTDLPIICLGLLLFSRLDNPDFVLGIVSFIGSIFVGYLGVISLFRKQLKLELARSSPRSYLKGILTNILSPHPYLFWFTVGVPTILKAHEYSWLSPWGFVVAFYVCIVGAKVTIALIAARSRQFLTGSKYFWALRCLGALLVAFSLVLLYDGLTLTGLIR